MGTLLFKHYDVAGWLVVDNKLHLQLLSQLYVNDYLLRISCQKISISAYDLPEQISMIFYVPVELVGIDQIEELPSIAEIQGEICGENGAL